MINSANVWTFCLKIIALRINKDGWMSTYFIDKIYEFDEY